MHVHSFHSPPGKHLESNYLLILTFKHSAHPSRQLPPLQQEKRGGAVRLKKGKLEQSIGRNMGKRKWDEEGGECMWVHHACLHFGGAEENKEITTGTRRGRQRKSTNELSLDQSHPNVCVQSKDNQFTPTGIMVDFQHHPSFIIHSGLLNRAGAPSKQS